MLAEIGPKTCIIYYSDIYKQILLKFIMYAYLNCVL